MALALNLKLDVHGWVGQVRSRLVFRKPELPDVILAVGCISLVVVCLGLLGVPAFHRLQMRAKAAAVIGNAATVQLAAETFAASHGGRYASDPLDLLPYLPGDSAPVNPYSAETITFTGEAGDLRYRSPTRGDDYIIEAFAMGPGRKPRLVERLSGHRTR